MFVYDACQDCFTDCDIFDRCKTSALASHAIKVVVLGCDWFVNWVLRPYVDLFSAISSDFLSLVRFLFVPLGKCQQ